MSLPKLSTHPHLHSNFYCAIREPQSALRMPKVIDILKLKIFFQPALVANFNPTQNLEIKIPCNYKISEFTDVSGMINQNLLNGNVGEEEKEKAKRTFILHNFLFIVHTHIINNCILPYY